ncbi:unnamed protein product [Ranitomeya imitator]|uniref:Uncharacterized protein n=1 Tax=Ranitomeya imitator TaxID=111125 RepID=A0ABN9L8N1_9NEOB|nr:unnamed protein product [Ranitomeya imitator]
MTTRAPSEGQTKYACAGAMAEDQKRTSWNEDGRRRSGPETPIRPDQQRDRPWVSYIGGLSTALQNAVDKPLMPVGLPHPRFSGYLLLSTNWRSDFSQYVNGSLCHIGVHPCPGCYSNISHSQLPFRTQMGLSAADGMANCVPPMDDIQTILFRGNNDCRRLLPITHRIIQVFIIKLQMGLHMCLLEQGDLAATVGFYTFTMVFIMISSLMLLTQRITSLALDIHEKKVTVNIDEAKKNGLHHLSACSKLAVLSYFLFFPALLGGPLCSFAEFQKQISTCKVCDIRTVIKAGALFFFFHALQGILFAHITFPYDLTNCRRWECVCVMWSTALLFRLTYYSQWLLDEALLCGAGFYIGESSYGDFTDGNIYTLETTHRISSFARTWNKSTAKWLRRLIFQNCSKKPLLSTFAFSAWWHGLYPGQIFGFMCWALMVEADYRIHAKLGVILKSPIIRFLCKVITWVETQMIIAFIMLAVEMRSLTMLLALLLSFNSLFPFFYCVLLIVLNNLTPPLIDSFLSTLCIIEGISRNAVTDINHLQFPEW